MSNSLKTLLGAVALCAQLALTGRVLAEGAGVKDPGAAQRGTLSPAEMAKARQWVAAKFTGVQKTETPEPRKRASGPEPFFSFVYDGKPASELLATWDVKRSSRELDGQRTEHTIVYTDPKTGLAIRCEGVEFSEFPAVEWVLKLENTGKADTPILDSIQALDTEFPDLKEGTLHWARGGVASFDDFAPQEKSLRKQGDKTRLQPGGGRSSHSVLPFFNVASSDGGVVMAIGWSGEWAAEFISNPTGMALKAGMAQTHLLLHPDEEIRTPRILLLFYGGERWRGQNLLRQFILAHHRPTLNGKPLVAPITWGVWGATSAAIHLYNIQKIIEHKLPVDYYWVDAGWFGKINDWAGSVGDWEISKELYPAGFKPLSNALEKSGGHLMVWFEPERAFKGTPWEQAQPGWILRLPNDPNTLVNLGNPEARRFVTDFLLSKIDEFGLGCYRQDCNIDPLKYWQTHDPENRRGMSEIRHIEGLYAFWDELRAKHPDLLIDNCASGGRRIDLETTCRSTPFWRTDGPRDAVAHQCHSYGLMAWIPLSATSEDRQGDDYEFRSSMCSGLCINWLNSGDGPWRKFPADFPFAWAKNTLDQYLSLRKYYYGDYYPLTPYTQDRGAWMAWQFDCPETGEGMLQAFRRDLSIYESARLKLHGLKPDATYSMANLDSNALTGMTGRALMEEGLPIVIESQPGAAIITYRKRD